MSGDFIDMLEKMFTKLSKSPIGRSMTVTVEMGIGSEDLEISYSDYKRCRSKKERCELIQSVIRGGRVH